MPVLAIFTADFNRDQYDALRKEVNWEGDQPQGILLHVASFDDSGRAHVVDVWSSADDMNAFVGERLMPVFQKHGFNPPKVDVYPAHNINAYKALDQHRI